MEKISGLEYEIDEVRFSNAINGTGDFSNELGLTTEPCIALKRKIKIKQGEEQNLNFVITVGEDLEHITNTLEYYKIQENVKQEFNIAKAKAEEETRYLNLSKSNIETFNILLPYIMHENPMRSLYLEYLADKEYKQSDFWKYGISGDIPIILVVIKYAGDIDIAREMLKVHELLRVKGIQTDLCILDYEKNVYERYVKDQLVQEILNLQIGYLQNISGGIFLLNANEIEDEDLFKFKASIIINCSKGSVRRANKRNRR